MILDQEAEMEIRSISLFPLAENKLQLDTIGHCLVIVSLERCLRPCMRLYLTLLASLMGDF
jgi:hypothetical protein